MIIIFDTAMVSYLFTGLPTMEVGIIVLEDFLSYIYFRELDGRNSSCLIPILIPFLIPLYVLVVATGICNLQRPAPHRPPSL